MQQMNRTVRATLIYFFISVGMNPLGKNFTIRHLYHYQHGRNQISSSTIKLHEFKQYMLEFTQNEDCLVANVFVPDTKKRNLSVLVYVHGGAFQYVSFFNLSPLYTSYTPTHLRTYLFLFLVGIVICESLKDEWLEVNTAQGPVRGHRHDTGELFVFYGIPYATAPTGEQKFKGPLPPPTWKEPLDAIDSNVVCAQFGQSVREDKNCLIANVYVPDTQAKNLSVLVNIHGGGFQLGYGDGSKYKNLLKDKDIILVNFNYRLGIQGFLCLDTEDVPGNAGMKDQVALLRWVQQNIAAFGGNPNDVTISGQSAGSVSVDLLMMSKQANGLFHKAIPESGANLAAFAIQSDPLQTAKDHAKILHFANSEDIFSLEKFYKTLPAETLTVDAFYEKTDSTFMFSPCIEHDTGDGAFLTESPLDILKRGDYNKVPVLYGLANMEGLFRLSQFDSWKHGINNNFSDFLPADLKLETETEKQEVAKQIKEFYFGDQPVANNNILSYVDYFSDVLFSYPMLRAVKLYAEAGHSEIYLYEYSFVDEDTPIVPYTDNVRGAGHCAQSDAIRDGNGESGKYMNMKKKMRGIWHSFIKTGKPVPEGSSLPAWPAAGADRSPHMSLGEVLELRGALLEKRSSFWDNIYKNFYRQPIPPSH